VEEGQVNKKQNSDSARSGGIEQAKRAAFQFGAEYVANEEAFEHGWMVNREQLAEMCGYASWEELPREIRQELRNEWDRGKKAERAT
jgi:hypothetical protein